MAGSVETSKSDPSPQEANISQPVSALLYGANPTLYENHPSDCDICQQIMRGFHTPFSQNYQVDLGPADVVLSKQCSAHFPLLAGLKERFESDQRSFVKISLQESRMKVSKIENTTNLDITMDENKMGGAMVETLELVSSGASTGHPGRGVIPDAQWIDTSLFKKWKECCQHSHGEGCEHPLRQYRLSQSTPAWLIDVQNRCLIPGQPEISYVALSYKWGQTEGLKTMIALLPQLHRPNALTELGSQIPETIRNAMDVVQLLGEDHLWVDSLCIAQDDEGIKFRELNQMAAIYANSTVTIIAAEGENAEHGLCGIQGVSKKRELKQVIFEFGDKEKVIKPKFPWYRVAQSPYFKRGWTFQEYLFSKRRLIFEDRTVRWECSRCAWHEDITHVDGPESKFRCNWMDVVVDGYPSLGAFGYMLLEYNDREFTYAEDALPAITGLISMLSQKYEGGFLCGLPEMYFDAALNWGGWVGDLSRRSSSGLSLASKSLTRLPSWSWIGWKGRIAGGWRSNEDYIKNGRYTTPMYTVPITEWYTGDTPFEGTRRRIKSKFLRERDIYKDHLDRPLPRGWTRHTHDLKDSPAKAERRDNKYEYPPPERCGSCFYTHETAPGTEFWYPIPILDSGSEAILPPQTQYLFCDTHRAFLNASYKEGDEKHFSHSIWMRDQAGAWAGVLLLHREEDFEFFSTDLPSGPHVELVAISRGYISNDETQHAPTEMTCEERPKSSLLYEFYNVLWIEWKDGIAYRRAHGRVLKDVWERQDLEPLSLILG